MKRLALALLFAASVSTVFADTETVNGIEWRFTISGGNAELGDYNLQNYSSISAVPVSTSGSITIPTALGGCPVTSIRFQAFSGCSGLTAISIPNGVTSIGSAAFRGCSALKSITIPSGITSLESFLFEDCSGLTSVAIPSSVTRIESFAFSGCSGLKSIAIPSSVTNIENYAFYGCSGLTETRIHLSSIAKWFSDFNRSALSSSGARRLFVDGREINNLVIPNGVANIEPYVYHCSGLTSITIPNSVTSIDDYAFSDCSGLTSITIPNSVTSIGEEAFSACSGLKSITIPRSVRIIGHDAFKGCSGLKSITILGDITTETCSEPLFGGCNASARLILGEKLTKIGDGMFEGLKLTGSVVIPDKVTSIGDDAFAGCSGLESVTIPNSVTSVGHGAFFDCSGLSSVIIGKGVKSLGGCAFSYCVSLRSVTIPSSVTSIGESAFSGCSKLTSITMPSSITSIEKGVFSGCSGLTSITIPNSVTRIGEGAFSGCSGLKSITIPASVTNIGRSAFKDCSKLEEVVVEGTVSLSTDAFPSNLKKLTFLGNAPSWEHWQWKTDPTADGFDDRFLVPSSYDGTLNLFFPNCIVYVNPESTGWKTSISGKWRGLTIRFLSNTYTVKFSACGGKGTMAAQKLTVGKAAKLRKNAFSRKGWVFVGWSKAKTGAVAFKNGATVKNLAKTGKAVTLYARWAKKNYKVAFYANGGTGKMAVQKMTYGKKAKLKANKFKRKGYVFKGWAKSKALAKKGKVAYKNRKTVKNLVANGKTVKLYAVWKKK